MPYSVFVASNAVLLLLVSVVCMKLVHGHSFPDWDGYEDPDIDDDDPCSDQMNTELTEIRADLRAVMSLVEGLRQKLDPDFKPVATEESTACPEGFDYLSEAGACYKVIMEKQTWSKAMEQCHSLSPNAHLIAIESQEESEAVTNYLNKQFPSRKARKRCRRAGLPYGNTAFWTSGQRVNMSDCSSEFVWKTTADGEAPFNYTQWYSEEPNCMKGDEKCAELLLGRGSNWNDIKCDTSSCLLCEYDLN